MSRFKFAERLGFEAPFEFENDIPEQEEVISQNKSGVIRVRNIVRFHNSDSKLSVLPPKGSNDLILYVNKKNDKPLLKGKVTRFKDSGITFYDIELVGLGLGKNLRKAVEENRQENPHIIINDLMNWLGINDASHLETRAILHSWILEYIKEYPSDFVPDTPNGFDNLFELFQLCIELGVIDLSETAGYIADEVFAAFAKAIRDQKLGNHRWNPIPEDKYDPLFPNGSTIKEGIIGVLEAIGLDTIDNSGNPKVTNTHTGENEYLRGINGLLVSELKQVILWFKNLILEAVTDAADLAGEAIKLYNAFIVGLINGLIDLLASLVDVLGFIIGLLNNDKQNTIIAAINKFIKEFGWDTIKAFIGKIFTNFIKFFDKESYEQAYTIGKLIPKIIEIAIDTYFFVKGGVKVVKKVADLAKDLPEILKQANKTLDDLIINFKLIGINKKALAKAQKNGVKLKVSLIPVVGANPIKVFDGRNFLVEYQDLILRKFKNEKDVNEYLKRLEDPKFLQVQVNLVLKRRRDIFRRDSIIFKNIDDWIISNRARFNRSDGKLDFNKVQNTWWNNSSIVKSELSKNRTRDLGKFRVGTLFNRNIATAKLRLEHNGKVFEFDEIEHSGKNSLIGSKGNPPNRNIKEEEFFDTELEKPRKNDSESKISELVKEHIAKVSEELGVPFEKIKVTLKIETTYDPCNVCKREILLLQEVFNADVEILRPFYINDKGIKKVVIDHKTFLKI